MQAWNDGHSSSEEQPASIGAALKERKMY